MGDYSLREDIGGLARRHHVWEGMPAPERDTQPEVKLFFAILTRALQDAVMQDRSLATARREARKWLRSSESGAWSCGWILEQIGWPPCSRWRMWRYVVQEDARGKVDRRNSGVRRQATVSFARRVR